MHLPLNALAEAVPAEQSHVFSKAVCNDVRARQLPTLVEAVGLSKHLDDVNRPVVMIEFRSLGGGLCFRDGCLFQLPVGRAEETYPGVKAHFGL